MPLDRHAKDDALQPTVKLAEFDLLIEACRSLFDPAASAGLAIRLQSVDWDRLILAAKRHRVEGLMWQALNNAGVTPPESAARTFAAMARTIAERGLRDASESARIRAAFAGHGIDLIFLKGLTLGELAYGNPFIKMGWDIDLLISADRVAGAAGVLIDLGYAPIHPAGPVGAIERWHRQRKESVWRSSDGQHFVELHSRLADHPRLIHSIDISAPRQLVTIAPGIDLPTLATEELFAYLAVHGASSAWFRLKWITDFAALLKDRDEAVIARHYEQSQQLGAGRAAGQALLLADRLFGTVIGPALRSRLEADRSTRWLVASALRMLRGQADYRDPTEVRLGTARIHLSQLALIPGWRFTLSEAWRQARDVVTARGFRVRGDAQV